MEHIQRKRETSVLLRAVEELHAGQDGLVALGQLVGSALSAPRAGKKVVVAVVGNGQGPAELIESYTGKPMKNKGLGTESQFTVVEYGVSKSLSKGDDALKKLPQADRLTRVTGLEKSFCSEQCESTHLDFELVNFVRLPLIEGKVKGDKASVDEALERVREALSDEKVGSLRKVFEGIDVNNDGGISQQEFVSGIEKLDLGLKLADLHSAFDVIDVTQDGEIELDEFIAAFKPSGVTYPYDLEDAVLQVAEVADVVIALADPKRTRINAREMELLGQLYQRCKYKMHMCVFLAATMATESNLGMILDETRNQLATRLRDSALKSCKLVWCTNAKFESKFENAFEGLCEDIALKVVLCIAAPSAVRHPNLFEACDAC